MEMGEPKLGWSGVRNLPSGKYQGRWAIPDENNPGHTTTAGETFNTKDQARTHARKQADEILNVKVGLGVAKKPMTEAVADFLDQNLDPKTIALYKRRLMEFIAAFPDKPEPPLMPMPGLMWVEQLSDEKYITRFDKLMAARGCNPGGRNHVLRIVRTFCNYAMHKNRRWLSSYPFEDFKMPTSEFEGRPITDEEYALILTPTIGRMNQHALDETDRLLALAFRLGRGMIVRISQVWKLTATDFREPGEVFIQGIKDQEPEWKPLHGDALTVVRILLAGTEPGKRFFGYWGSIEAMRNAVQDKVRRCGVKPQWDAFKSRWVYPRYHDICKVTAVSELAAVPGMSLADLEHITNTSGKTLQAHYIKADKERSYAKYRAHLAAQGVPTAVALAARANPVPTATPITAEMPVQGGTPAEIQGTGFLVKTPLNLAEKTSLDEAI